MERENAIPEKSIHAFVKQAELWRLHSEKSYSRGEKNRLCELLLILFYGELSLKSAAECAIALFSIYQNDILLPW